MLDWYNLHAIRSLELPDDDQELRLKYARPIINTLAKSDGNVIINIKNL